MEKPGKASVTERKVVVVSRYRARVVKVVVVVVKAVAVVRV